MKIQEQNTKEMILNTALELFCINGYTTVSIRDIGRVVGIKESSIYYHYKNKEDILQTILIQAEQYTQRNKNNFNQALYAISEFTCDNFIMVGMAYLENYLLEEKIYKLIRMLTIEKQRNKEAADIYHNLLYSTPLEHHRKVFTFLMENGFMKTDNPGELAEEYQAIILYIFQKHFSDPTNYSTDSKNVAKKELTVLLRRFFNHYVSKEDKKYECL